MKLVWDQVGERIYERGVNQGVLYLIDDVGEYPLGVSWNGLTAVTESPGGAEPTDFWADNIKYASIRGAETFGATIEAYTYPDEFASCDGSVALTPGVVIGQQNRQAFGLCYKTDIGNDTYTEDDDGYKLHIIYNATVSPSDKAYSTINDTPDIITFSWELVSTPIPVTGKKPTSTLVIDSTKVNAAKLADLEDILYGTSAGGVPHLPLPDEVLAILTGTPVVPTAPTFVAATGVLTIPTKAGVAYTIGGQTVASGPMTAIPGGQAVTVVAIPTVGYYFEPGVNYTWYFVSTKP